DHADFGQLCVVGVLVQENPEDNQVYDKLLTWYECPGADGTGTVIGTAGSVAPPACGTAGTISETLGSNLDDQAWYMPLDVAKAHRGFLDGDFVMMLYAKSPNFKQNAVGNDRYELYQRRSFDGGATWTVTPSSFLASDGISYTGTGTVTCETWRDALAVDESHVCQEYLPGAPEQSRNMSQLQSMQFTILDPRYTPTIASMVEQDLTEYELTAGHFTYVPAGEDEFAETDIRRPDRHHIVFETGDNTTTAVGEAEPLNLNYGRAFNFGDHFQVWYDEVIDGDDIDTTTVCYPSDGHLDTSVDWADGTGFCNEFDALEGARTALSEEASVTSSAAGDFLYSVWGQVNLEDVDGELVDIGGSAMFRRVWWLDDYLPSDAWLPGQGLE
ncbi:MAG: choice-of-anchor O protein, partial [Gammaproteobacteria bacterium]